jgi:hypothetical protein
MLQMKFDAAIATFNEVLTRNPRAAEAHFYIAQAQAASGRYAAAWQSVGNAEALGAPVPQPFIDELTRKMPRPIAPLR